MASANKITRFLRGAFLGAALSFTSQQAQATALNASPSCTTENILWDAQPVSPKLLQDLNRIYDDLGGLSVTLGDKKFALSNTPAIRSLIEQAITDPDIRDDALEYVMPEYETFWRQQNYVLHSWPVMKEEERRMSLLNTIIGLNMLDEIFEEGFLNYIATTLDDPAAFMNSVDQIRNALGDVEIQDFEMAQDETCAPSQPSNARPEPAKTPAQYDHLLIG